MRLSRGGEGVGLVPHAPGGLSPEDSLWFGSGGIKGVGGAPLKGIGRNPFEIVGEVAEAPVAWAQGQGLRRDGAIHHIQVFAGGVQPSLAVPWPKRHGPPPQRSGGAGLCCRRQRRRGRAGKQECSSGNPHHLAAERERWRIAAKQTTRGTTVATSLAN